MGGGDRWLQPSPLGYLLYMQRWCLVVACSWKVDSQESAHEVNVVSAGHEAHSEQRSPQKAGAKEDFSLSSLQSGRASDWMQLSNFATGGLRQTDRSWARNDACVVNAKWCDLGTSRVRTCSYCPLQSRAFEAWRLAARQPATWEMSCVTWWRDTLTAFKGTIRCCPDLVPWKWISFMEDTPSIIHLFVGPGSFCNSMPTLNMPTQTLMRQ